MLGQKGFDLLCLCDFIRINGLRITEGETSFIVRPAPRDAGGREPINFWWHSNCVTILLFENDVWVHFGPMTKEIENLIEMFGMRPNGCLHSLAPPSMQSLDSGHLLIRKRDPHHEFQDGVPVVHEHAC